MESLIVTYFGRGHCSEKTICSIKSARQTCTCMFKVLFKSTTIACTAGQCSIPVQQWFICVSSSMKQNTANKNTLSSVWFYMRMCGTVWLCMGMYGNVWSFMAMYGRVWACMGMGMYGHGHVWSCLVMFGYVWPWIYKYGFVWSCLGMYGHALPCMVWSYMTS